MKIQIIKIAQPPDHILISYLIWLKNLLGEKLSKEEAKGLMNELCDPEDDEGFTPFMRKLKYILHLKL